MLGGMHVGPHMCRAQLQSAKAHNYLLMCQSIRQSCDPGCLSESPPPPPHLPRRAWGVIHTEFPAHTDATEDNGNIHNT